MIQIEKEELVEHYYIALTILAEDHDLEIEEMHEQVKDILAALRDAGNDIEIIEGDDYSVQNGAQGRTLH